MTETMIEAKNLKKYFFKSSFLGMNSKVLKAVDGVDFSLKKGQVLGIVGESGCGKSTVGRMMAGLIQPTAGSLTYRGEPLNGLRRNIQMVFQDPYSSLNPRKRVGEMMKEGLALNKPFESERERELEGLKLLAKVGLGEEVWNRYPHQFSGGQRQRLSVARALTASPDILICDEALSALDVSIQAQMVNLFLDLKNAEQLTYVFISHDLHLVRLLADYVLVLYLGKPMEWGPTAEVFLKPQHPYTQALLAAVPNRNPELRSNRALLKGEIPSLFNPPQGCPFNTRCPYARPECQNPPPIQSIGPQHYTCILPPKP